MFASAGEEERVPVRTVVEGEGEAEKREEREREKRGDEGLGGQTEAIGRLEKDGRKNREGTHIRSDQTYAALMPHLRLLLLRVCKVHLRPGPTASLP